MKKIILCCICSFILCFFAFGKTCKDHGYNYTSYCPECEYNKANNKGSLNSGVGKKYNDSFCNSSNETKEKICRDGYSDGYGEKIWCNNCYAYFPTSGHTCKIKK